MLIESLCYFNHFGCKFEENISINTQVIKQKQSTYGYIYPSSIETLKIVTFKLIEIKYVEFKKVMLHVKLTVEYTVSFTCNI